MLKKLGWENLAILAWERRDGEKSGKDGEEEEREGEERSDENLVFLVLLFRQLDSSCFDKYDLSANAFPQFVQENGLSAEWVCVCALRLLLSAKLFAQILQENGFSPVCVRICPWSSQGREKDFPQKGHSQPAPWVRMCIARAAGLLYSRAQFAHFFPPWLVRWDCLWRARLLLLL